MKKNLIRYILILGILMISVSFVNAQNCTITYHHKECFENDVWWYNDCNERTFVAWDCGSNQNCIDAQCKNKCGNGICEPEIGETCSSCWNDCKCGDYEKCEWGVCKTYCGNGRCEGEENCLSCSGDCRCPSDEKCEHPGVCKTYCGNGRCDGNENCQSCYDCSCDKNQDCNPSSSRANSRGCVDRCGNGIKDWDENCQTCPKDAPCSEGSYCYNGNCVECFKDSHCESREVPTGEFICTSDFRNTLEKVMKTQGVCQNQHCTGEKVETTKPGQFCGDKLCQDGECGCKEGFAACLKSGKCEKQSILEDGQSCSCYFQCSSNYCNPEGKCVKAINAPLSASSTLIKVGEQTKVTISADNSLEEDIPTKITLNLDSGAVMSGIIGGSDCSGNQCTGGQVIIPSKARVAITIDVQGQSYGKLKFTATITPMIEGKAYPKEEELYIVVINPGDGICSEGETTQNACSDCGCPEGISIYDYTCGSDQICKKGIKIIVYLIFAGIVGLVALSICTVPKARNYYAKISADREKRKSEREQKEFEERKKITHALYKFKKNIKIDNPPDVDEVISKLKLKDVDPALIHEEYLELLDRMKQTKEAFGAEKEEAKRILEKPIRHLAQRFCTGCGARQKEGSKFCTKCGRAVKK